jgi:hypothetical protein
MLNIAELACLCNGFLRKNGNLGNKNAELLNFSVVFLVMTRVLPRFHHKAETRHLHYNTKSLVLPALFSEKSARNYGDYRKSTKGAQNY